MHPSLDSKKESAIQQGVMARTTRDWMTQSVGALLCALVIATLAYRAAASPESQGTPQGDPTPAPITDPTPEPTADPTPTPEVSPSPTPTVDPSPTPTSVPSPTPTASPTPTPTTVPTPTPTPPSSGSSGGDGGGSSGGSQGESEESSEATPRPKTLPKGSVLSAATATPRAPVTGAALFPNVLISLATGAVAFAWRRDRRASS